MKDDGQECLFRFFYRRWGISFLSTCIVMLGIVLFCIVIHPGVVKCCVVFYVISIVSYGVVLYCMV